jgi:hypothetical protein
MTMGAAERHPPMRLIPALFLTLAAASQAPAAHAEDSAPSSVGEAIGRMFEGVGLRNSPPPSADFVTRSRPSQLDYAPFATQGSRPDKTKIREDSAALQKELEAAGAANRARAARVKRP